MSLLKKSSDAAVDALVEPRRPVAGLSPRIEVQAPLDLGLTDPDGVFGSNLRVWASGGDGNPPAAEQASRGTFPRRWDIGEADRGRSGPAADRGIPHNSGSGQGPEEAWGEDIDGIKLNQRLPAIAAAERESVQPEPRSKRRSRTAAPKRKRSCEKRPPEQQTRIRS